MSSERRWIPMQQGEVNPQLIDACLSAGAHPPMSVWQNDVYQCTVYRVQEGPDDKVMVHLSMKRHDREAVHDWRHLQAIKNEVCGFERYAVEIYPPESRLVDSANEYHLWVFPPGFELPFGFADQLISSDWQIADFNAKREIGHHKGRQRPFQPGLPVAQMRNLHPDAGKSVFSLTAPMRQLVPEPYAP